jgi:hypothetical protein
MTTTLLVLILLAVLFPGLVRGVFTLIGLCLMALIAIGGCIIALGVEVSSRR